MGRSQNRWRILLVPPTALIALLLANMRNDAIDEATFERYSMQSCIEKALEDFPFRADGKTKIYIDKTIDFYFNGLDTLLIYVFYNLIKNALCEG